jgi:uncharacterized protein with FMN-binding domain
MRRAPIVLTATAAGTAGVLAFHAHTPEPTAAATATPSPAAAAATPTPTPTRSSSAAKTATGDVIPTRYGNVQLKVTVSGGKITSVEAVQLPTGDPKSYAISSYAEPLLRQSALSKQNGDVDAVSGATYTSEGYKSALQSALDKAGFQA